VPLMPPDPRGAHGDDRAGTLLDRRRRLGIRQRIERSVAHRHRGVIGTSGPGAAPVSADPSPESHELPSDHIRGLIRGLRDARPATVGTTLKELADACSALGLVRSAAAAQAGAAEVRPDRATTGPLLEDLLPRLERLLSEEQGSSAGLPSPITVSRPDLARFPLASHHLAEAARCLEVRLPTAAVFHGMAAARIALAACDILPGGGLSAGAAWTAMLRAAATSTRLPDAARPLLAEMETVWFMAGADSVEKYTEREAEALVGGVRMLIQRLAGG